MSDAIMKISDIQRELGIGRDLAERYARESGALLPRVKGGPYMVRRHIFTEWFNKEKEK
jgi:hypothetical protein